MPVGGTGTGAFQDATGQAILAALGGGTAATWANRGATTLNSLVVKASAGTLYEVQAVNENAGGTAARWLMIFDAAILPANGTAPLLMPYLLSPGQSWSIWQIDRTMTVGIVLAISTSNTTLTVSADAPGTASMTASFS